MAHYPQPPEKIQIIVDKERFLNTRNALTNAFVGLSGAIDEAVKAYVNHTNAVLDGVGGSTLDVSGLIQPFNAIGQAQGVAQLAQQAIFQNGNGVWTTPTNPQLNPDGTKKKRQYKPRDPNAPKRPLTAYFRYLQEQRPIISVELQNNPELQGGKAGDISKIATERWNSLDDKTRLPYRKAYERELKGYEEAVKKYKQETGQLAGDDEDADADAAAEEDDQVLAPVAQMQAPVTAKADDTDDSDDSDDTSSDDDESEDEAPPPAPQVQKKTPKPAPKKTKAGADPVAPTPQFSSLSTPNAAAPSSPTRKRKADATEGDEKKKRGRKSKAEKEAAESAAAAAQLHIDPQLQNPQPILSSQLTDGTDKPKKEKKKKRKSEAGAA
ncbi:Hypothetical predicted protein [Lecanosticta acicola]|uniref:HMG box domain-containing protein n=1 Tax=Lecanosticta acicola TaxID=111012 RepID=A0AAI8YW99_9PEZI|nr:Hypothetical predicted protein [Lecanosticta acicola]